MSHPVYDLPADVSWEESLDWRKEKDPDLENEVTDDELDDDVENLPTPGYVIQALGFDPKEWD